MFVFVAFQQHNAVASENTPEAKVRAFYAWFMKHDPDKPYPIDKPEIRKYIAPETVSRLRNEYAHDGPPGDVDYFLKVQDYDAADWLAHTSVRPAVMLNGVAVVPVTFGSKDKVDVLVFLKKLRGDWEIIKIDDTLEYR